jgi:DNA helicase-2/ATP-dependent DNA helicase PcrA
VELVEDHEWVLRTLAARFPNIYVDEYQDLPPGLDRLVQSLCFDERANAELFAVGDPDQAIFGYAGTAPHLIKDLADRPGVNDVWLDVNYRNPQGLIDAALEHLGEERQIEGRVGGGTIEAIRCDRGFDHQIATSIKLVERARKDGTPLDEIAILARFNRELDQLVEAFGDTEIPIFTRRNRGYRPTQVTDLVEAMAAWTTQARDDRGVVLRDVIRKLQSALGADYDLVRAAIDVMIEFRHRPAASASEFIDAIADAGFESRLRRRGREDELQEFEKQRKTFSQLGPVSDATITDLGFRARARDRLLVSSIHGAKGLEFDVVIIVDVDQGRMPFFRSSTPKEKAEDRRMFYVAITRARKTVYCLWTGWREFKGRRFEDGPSEYLIALKLA